MNDKIAKTKKIVKFVVGLSVSYVVSSAIANNVDPEKRHHKVEAVVGGTVVGWMVADHAEEWSSAKIDDLVAKWHDVKSEIAAK